MTAGIRPASGHGAEPAAQALSSRAETPLWTLRGFSDASGRSGVLPGLGWLAVLMLAMISFYQLPDTTGPMHASTTTSAPKDAVGTVRASIGLVATLVGIAAGGFSAVRWHCRRSLVV
jgi:PAT family beta-lactamase induction signal transducer AmpG